MRRSRVLGSTLEVGKALAKRTSPRNFRVWYVAAYSKRESQTMPDEQPPGSANRELATEIVAAYVRRNQITSDQLPTLIKTVHQVLSRLGAPAEVVGPEHAPAVPIRRSVTRDVVVCLECGWKGSMLRRHLMTRHELGVDQYRSRWKLSLDHPITAPGYSERRSAMARRLGLGQRGRGSRTTAASETSTPRRRTGRPRAPRS